MPSLLFSVVTTPADTSKKNGRTLKTKIAQIPTTVRKGLALLTFPALAKMMKIEPRMLSREMK